MITNKINGKKYIGQAHDIGWRWSHHKCDLNNNQHHNKHLQSAWNLYGSANFDFSVVEETEEFELDAREMYWIEYYNSYYDGYNNDFGGQGCVGYKHTEDEINRMRRIQNPKIVMQFDLNYNFIKEWIGGASHVDKELGYTKECITSRCNHTIKKMSAYKDSYWVYKDEYINPQFSWDAYMKNIQIINTDKTVEGKTVRKINQYSLTREYIKTWNSLADIRKEFGNTSSISAILYHRKGKKTAYGYIWTFDDYDFSDGYFDTLDKYYNKAIEERKRVVAKINPESFEIIKTYSSITDAANDNNINISNICVAAKGYPNHKSSNFLWKYIE